MECAEISNWVRLKLLMLKLYAAEDKTRFKNKKKKEKTDQEAVRYYKAISVAYCSKKYGLPFKGWKCGSWWWWRAERFCSQWVAPGEGAWPHQRCSWGGTERRVSGFRIARRCRIIQVKREIPQDLVVRLIMAANAGLGSTEAHEAHALEGLELTAVAQSICSIPPKTVCGFGVCISAHRCLAAHPQSSVPAPRIAASRC